MCSRVVSVGQELSLKPFGVIIYTQNETQRVFLGSITELPWSSRSRATPPSEKKDPLRGATGRKRWEVPAIPAKNMPRRAPRVVRVPAASRRGVCCADPTPTRATRCKSAQSAKGLHGGGSGRTRDPRRRSRTGMRVGRGWKLAMKGPCVEVSCLSNIAKSRGRQSPACSRVDKARLSEVGGAIEGGAPNPIANGGSTKGTQKALKPQELGWGHAVHYDGGCAPGACQGGAWRAGPRSAGNALRARAPRSAAEKTNIHGRATRGSSAYTRSSAQPPEALAGR